MTVFQATIVTRLGAESNGTRMTREEFLAAEWDELLRFELVNGVVIVNPPPSPGERSPNDALRYLLRRYQEDFPDSPLDDTLPEQVVETKTSIRWADRAVWIGLGRAPRPLQDRPAILIELVSRTSRDRKRDYVEKRREYAEIGVPEYWVIDRFDRTMTVCFADGSETVVGEDDTYTTDLLPGFALPLAPLLVTADRYAEPEGA